MLNKWYSKKNDSDIFTKIPHSRNYHSLIIRYDNLIEMSIKFIPFIRLRNVYIDVHDKSRLSKIMTSFGNIRWVGDIHKFIYLLRTYHIGWIIWFSTVNGHTFIKSVHTFKVRFWSCRHTEKHDVKWSLSLLTNDQSRLIVTTQIK